MRDAAIEVFQKENKAFNDKLLAREFNNSTEALTAREIVGEAFDQLCEMHAELVAAKGGTWFEIARYKPAFMTDEKAHKKKQDAIFRARAAFKLEEAKAAVERARLANEKIAREAKESAE